MTSLLSFFTVYIFVLNSSQEHPKHSASSLLFSLDGGFGIDPGFQDLPVLWWHNNLKKAEQVNQTLLLSLNNSEIFSVYGHGKQVWAPGHVALLQETHFHLHLFARQRYFQFLTCHCSTSSTSNGQVLAASFYLTTGNYEFIFNFKDRSSHHKKFYILMQTRMYDKRLSALWPCEHPNFKVMNKTDWEHRYS